MGDLMLDPNESKTAVTNPSSLFNSPFGNRRREGGGRCILRLRFGNFTRSLSPLEEGVFWAQEMPPSN